MRRALAVFCLLLFSLLAATQASARVHARHLTLHIGDLFVVAGTDLACVTQVGKHVLVGQKLVTCFKVKGSGLAPSSYIAAIGVDGRVVVARINAAGNIGAAVFNRKPAVISRTAARRYTVHPGDQLLLAGTDLACAVNDDSSGIYPTCFRVTRSGGRPGSYAFAVTERFVVVVRFNSTGKKSTVIFKRIHGR